MARRPRPSSPLRLHPAVVEIAHDGPVAVIGDIHGRLDHLDRLLAKLPDETELVVVGDLCDRGPDTRGVITRLIERGARGCMGNHEEWFSAWCRGFGFDVGAMAYGAEATLTSYGSVGRDITEVSRESALVPSVHRAWIESLAVAVSLRVDDQSYWVVHAGIPNWVSFDTLRPEQVVPTLARKRPEVLLWSFTKPADTVPVDRPVIMGHMSVRRAQDLGHVVALDTQCGSGGYLSAVLLPQRIFVDSR